MSFAAPALLAALGLWLPVLAAFLYRRSRGANRVPSIEIWRRIAVAHTRSVRIRNLARVLALCLCLLGVGALVVGAARPIGFSRGETVAFVVDVSASMAAGGRDSPFRRARAFLGRALEARGPADRYAIVAAGAEPRCLAPVTDDSAILDEALRRLAVELGQADLQGAVRIAAEMIQAGVPGSGRVVVLDDGGEIGDVSSAEEAPVYEKRFALPFRDNLGITALEVRVPGDATADDEREALVAVATSSDRSRRARVTLEAQGHPIAVRPVDLVPGGTAEVQVHLRAFTGRLVARVRGADGVRDALGTDDDAAIPLETGTGPRVVVASRDGVSNGAVFFVEQAIRAAGVREIRHASAADPGTRPGDLVVFVGAGPPSRPDVPAFWVAPEQGSVPVARLRALDVATGGTRLLSSDRNHPLVRGVDLGGVAIARAMAGDPPPGARTLAALEGGPVLLAGGAGARRWVFCGIDPAGSDLALRVAFPVLVANALAWLGGGRSVLAASTLPRHEVSLPAATGPSVLRPPPGPRGLPLAPWMVATLLGALLLAAEGWAWKKGWAA